LDTSSRNPKPPRVAVVGSAFRLPGTQRETFWPALLEGRDLVTSVDPSRWALDRFYHPRKSEAGTSYTFAAGSLGEISGFDAAFFGISPREASQMDPQQRLLLELAWEALESSGIRPSSLRGGGCGVYVGMSSVDYGYGLAHDLAAMDASSATGSTASIAANRLSYFFDLHGPSMVIDTACSSSLVAFHQACRAIATGEAGEALVGGISLHLHPYGFIAFSKSSMLSRRGECRVFDASGDGYVRSEGGGVLVLKDLDRALADGNPILAVVAGSGVNTAGRSSSLTVPNPDAQAALLRDVYARAGIDPAEIDYLEAHGTGTVVGDPIEARALGQALGVARVRGRPLPIGSVKSNLGHLEAASGLAGLIKALHCIRHRMVPPTIHLDTPNPEIAFDELNLWPVTEPLALHPYKKLVVGVNSFGFGGANAHVVLESPPATPMPVEAAQGEVAIVVTGHNEGALRAGADALARVLRAGEEPALRDVAFTATHCRDWQAMRAVVTGSDRAAMAHALSQVAAGTTPASVVTGRALARASARAFVYSGNGSQCPGMGMELMRDEPVFRAAVERVDATFAPLGGFSIAARMAAGVTAEEIERTEIAQPLLFALQVGVTEVLREWGIAPARVTGHSVGEVAAAWASGALTLEDAVRVIHARSHFQGETRGAGVMCAAGLGEEEARALVQSLGRAAHVQVACVNSPRNVTLSGTREGIEAVEAELAHRRLFHRRLDLDYAFHGPAMEPVRQGLLDALAGLRPRAAIVPFHSAVTGAAATGEELGAAYWWRNIREPVRFHQAVQGLAGAGLNAFVEIGPHAILKNYISDGLRGARVDGRAFATLQRTAGDRAALRRAALQVVLAGCPADVTRMLPATGRLAELPAYPWQRERHWRGATAAAYDITHRGKEHPLLGYRLHENAGQWENHIDAQLYPAFADHVVGGATVFPAAGFAEMALAASALVHGRDAHDIESLEIRSPLVLDEGGARTVRFAFEGEHGRFAIRSRRRMSEDAWQLHVVGRVLADAALPRDAEAFALPARNPDVTGARHYEAAKRAGLEYGPAFQAVSRVWLEHEPGTAYARLALPRSIRGELGATHLHPAYLDGCFQLLVDLLRDEAHEHANAAFVPVLIGRLRLYRAHALVTGCRARIVKRGPRSLVASFDLHGPHGDRVASLEGVRFRGVQLRSPPAARFRHLAYRSVPRTSPAALPDASPAPLGVLVEACVDRLHDPARRAMRERYYREFDPLSDVLCAAFAERALRGLTGDAPLIDPAALTAATPPERWPMLRRAIQMLEEDQLLEPAEGGLRWSADADLPDAQEGWITLLRDHPDEAGLLVALGHAGNALGALLGARGDAPPRARAEVFARISSGAATYANAGRAIAGVLATALERMPAQRSLRVLELTPCRSELTLRAAQALDLDRCEYHVGCTMEGALLEYETLLEAYPTAAAFLADPGRAGLGLDPAHAAPFDVIVAYDGFATCADPDAALAHAVGALAHDGLLLMVAQHPSRPMDLLFGGDPAWWSAAGACRSRLRSPEDWDAALAQHGFPLTASVPEMPGIERGAYVLLARRDAPAPASMAAGADDSARWMVVQDRDGYSAALGACIQADLRARGHSTFEVAPAATDAQWAAALAAARAALGGIGGIVVIAGLPEGDAQPADAAAAIEHQAARCELLAGMLRACANGAGAGVWVVTAGATEGQAAEAVLWGYARTVANETAEVRIRRVDCTQPRELERTAAGLVEELLARAPDDEVVLKSNGRYALRLGNVAPPAAARGTPPAVAKLDFAAPGTLKGLAWKQAARRKPGPGEVEIEVRAAGLNFRDVMYAMGLLSDEAVEDGFAGPTLGMECAGVVCAVGRDVRGIAPGDEVLAFAPAAFATRVVTSAECVSRKPPGWSFEAAATVPIAFFTVYYSLKHLGQLREGERVLIHGAAGGVGIAAIQVAKWLGAEVFATAGSDDKREFVHLLGADHVLDSRSLAFADEVLRATGGEGVDLVLNSLSGEAMERNLRVLRPFGRFVELGKRDYYENTLVGMRPFRNNISYFGVDADQLMKHRPDLARRVFAELMELFEQGAASPLPYRAFAANEAIDAFRYMQQSRQIGKVVLSFADGVRTQPARPRPRALSLPSNATYLVTGGLSGFGLRTAQWLVERGARNLLLVSRSGAASLEARAAVADLEAQGATVVAEACDIAERASVRRLLTEAAAALPPLRGVIHAAAVIRDGLALNLTPAQLREVLAPKALGAANLDELTRGAKLDFFVMYSSATTMFGNPGQANYVAANSYLEALARRRRAEGRPALCISWGPIGDVGYLARHEKVRDALQSRLGGAPLESEAALAVLEQYLVSGEGDAAVLDFGWRTLRRHLPSAASPRFHDLGARRESEPAGADEQLELRRLAGELAPAELAALLAQMLRREVGEILRIAPERIDSRQALQELGMDSLMGMELVTALEARLGVSIPVMALADSPSIDKLVARVVSLLDSPGAGGDEAAGQDNVGLVAAQYATDLDARELDELADAIDEQRAASPHGQP
jgi:acyl transferase domain-containing protein/NADPH:quinone reductase-like Zn-dependent oxidoreductase/acyl carrier protein